MGIYRTTAGVALAAALLGSTNAGAQQHAITDRGQLQWVFTTGLTAGGDDLATVEYDDGDYSVDIEAGGLIYFGAGINYRFADSPLSIQAGLGYHFDGADADNGDASFSRIPIDVIGFYNLGNHRLGIGLTRHTNIDFEKEIESFTYYEKVDTDFSDATGFVIEYNYLFSRMVALGIRYTDIDYKYDYTQTQTGFGYTYFPVFNYGFINSIEYGSAKADGNNVGVFVHVLF